MTTALEVKTMRKVYLRLLPFTFALYLICYLDRANIGFAALTMNRDLGLGTYIYGLGAGAFFWGYFLLEVPSNLILERVGARRWIARIMITWGIVSGSFAFVSGPVSFFILRFLLGLAEAGFFPGMILYFTYWFPPFHRARIANWLAPDEKQWLTSVMAEERRRVEAEPPVSVWRSMIDRRVLALAAIHFAQAGVSVSMAVFIALMIKGLGLTNMQTGWLTSVPFIFGTIGILVWGHISDRMNERKWNLTASCMCMAVGLGLAAMLDGSYWSVAGLSLAMIGLYAGNAHLFPIPSMFLTGAAAASGIAWVNSPGILAGAVNPPILGWLKDSTGSYQSGLYFLAVLSVAGAIVTVIGVRETSAKLAPAVVPVAE